MYDRPREFPFKTKVFHLSKLKLIEPLEQISDYSFLERLLLYLESPNIWKELKYEKNTQKYHTEKWYVC